MIYDESTKSRASDSNLTLKFTKSPSIVPVNTIEPAAKFSVPIVHLLLVSSQTKDLVAESPLITSIPAFSVGVPEVKLLFRLMILSARLTVSVFTVAVSYTHLTLPTIYSV